MSTVVSFCGHITSQRIRLIDELSSANDLQLVYKSDTELVKCCDIAVFIIYLVKSFLLVYLFATGCIFR